MHVLKELFLFIQQFSYKLAVVKSSGDEELQDWAFVVVPPLNEGPGDNHGFFGHGSLLINNLFFQSIKKNNFLVLCYVYKDFL